MLFILILIKFDFIQNGFESGTDGDKTGVVADLLLHGTGTLVGLR